MDLQTAIKGTLRKPGTVVSPREPGKKPGALNVQEFRATTQAPVVLFYPRVSPASSVIGIFDELLESRAPLSVLALAGPLDEAGYRVKIVDSATRPDFEHELMSSLDGAICLGISSIAGYQVHEGLEVSRRVKAKYPSLPIIWGGWFPSMLTTKSIEDPHVDIVIRGQGEATFLEVVHRLSRNLPIDDVRGLVYKRDGQVVFTPERPIVDINQLPPLPYHLIDVEAHLRAGLQRSGKRTTSYYTSYGCPYQCTFCSNDTVFGPSWYALSPARVVDDIQTLVKNWGVEHLILDDANFFVSPKRTREICELLIERGLEGRFEWDATGTANIVSKLDEESLRLLKRSGCACIFIGAETASPELMSVFKKPITGEQTLKAAEALGRHGIVPDISFVVGVPGEPEDALDHTLDLIRRIYRANSEAKVFVFFFSPIPGVPLSDTPQVQASFEDPPRTLAEWADPQMLLHYSTSRLKLPPAYCRKVARLQVLTYMVNEERLLKRNLATRLLRRIALLRLQHMVLGVPAVESRIWRYLTRQSRS